MKKIFLDILGVVFIAGTFLFLFELSPLLLFDQGRILFKQVHDFLVEHGLVWVIFPWLFVSLVFGENFQYRLEHKRVQRLT